ncbi:Sacsin (DnaJ homolog subfamily C member 29) (DNAJC29) [Durusdinium trenchii]
MAGAREAHLEQLRKQGQILSRSLAILEEDEEEMPEEKVNTEALHALMKRENLFGDTDAQFNNAVQNLPSVKAARERAMQALDLPTSLYPTAVRMTELQHWTDRVSHQANILCLKRLRLLAGPHPAVCRQAAEALVTTGIMSGHGSGLFFGLEAVPQDFPEVLEELNRAWKGGHFGHWFGGPRAGRYLTCTLEDFWSWKFFHLFAIVLRMQDDLQLILEQMGSEGQRLSMEQQIMISFHSRGQQLPPWEDGAGRRSRRISLVFHPSHSHRRVSEGGALRLHKKGTAQVVEVPGGSAHWAIFRTAEVRQEVTKVNLPCGRWCITVCAEDTELARKLRPEHSALVNRAGTDVGGPEPVREVTCDCCSFSAGDGILLTCPGQHRLCRNCLLMELRRESVPSCTACAGEGDRIHLSSVWELMSQDHTALDDLGCCCTPGAEGCDSQIDVGAQVVVFGQSKSSGLNGQRGWTLWWDFEKQLWEVLLPSGRVLALRGSELALAEACEGRCIYDCPAWQVGRGLYPVSLGNRCCVKLGIDECSGDAHCPVGYPYFHGAEYLPFDSLLTSLDAVLFFLRHDFANFFHYNDMVDVHPPGLERIIFHNYRSWMHTFPHHHPQLDQPKLDRRIRRFRVLCRHSRDVRGARPLLFVRYVGDAPGELQRLEELYSLLRLWGGPNIRLCYVLMLQRNKKMPMSTPAQLGWDALTHRGSVGSLGLTATSARGRLYRHAEYPKVLFYLVDGLVDVMDFSVIRQASRFNVYDHAGLLLDCPAVTTGELLEMIAPFKDPYTNKSQTCIRTWLERPTEREQEVVNGFFPDCPRAQQPDQGRQPNQVLRLAVQRLDLRKLQGVLSDADANTWDAHGRRPLHDLCHVAGEQRSRCGLANILQIAAELLLAHGDPRARDKDGTTALALCRRLVPKKAPPELLALLRVAALDDCGARACPMPVLFRALELMGEPLRSKVSVNLFGLKPLRAVSDAELAWRTPSLGLKEQLEELDAELAQIQRMKPTARRKAIRRLLFEWHPDKNQHRHELATEAFQYLQVRKAELLKQTKPS